MTLALRIAWFVVKYFITLLPLGLLAWGALFCFLVLRDPDGGLPGQWFDAVITWLGGDL